MSKYQEAKNALNSLLGQKITIYGMGDFGFPYILQTVLMGFWVEPYAQYNESLVIAHQPKRKRKATGLRIYGDRVLLIWKGWQEIDAQAFVTVKDEGACLIQKSKYSSFDRRYTTDLLQSTPIKPVIALNTPEDKPEALTVACPNSTETD